MATYRELLDARIETIDGDTERHLAAFGQHVLTLLYGKSENDEECAFPTNEEPDTQAVRYGAATFIESLEAVADGYGLVPEEVKGT